ncbi:hypothetical protein [Streptomyces sp. C3-3]|uniref:hypothetical protein n=1 Tax=Streptomyces sp. C3-3 TaxID=2824901 RepID=UPI001B37C9B1|nr:hypothetical protein [Streptomyces sp. C3-3]MBQ1118549.1 hypothetical protein [Streptomyces sp. C3-3]
MTTQPELPTDIVEARLNHLIDRARRGRLLHEEADRFTTELRDLVRRMEDTEDERDRAEARVRELEAEVVRLTAVPDRTTLPKLHQRIVDTVTTAYPDLQPVADDLGHLMLATRDQHIEQLEQRITGLEALVARVRQTVDAGPVGSCCAHLIHAALQPPASPAVTKEPT